LFNRTIVRLNNPCLDAYNFLGTSVGFAVVHKFLFDHYGLQCIWQLSIVGQARYHQISSEKQKKVFSVFSGFAIGLEMMTVGVKAVMFSSEAARVVKRARSMKTGKEYCNTSLEKKAKHDGPDRRSEG
jgi:hypothetical protein